MIQAGPTLVSSVPEPSDRPIFSLWINLFISGPNKTKKKLALFSYQTTLKFSFCRNSLTRYLGPMLLHQFSLTMPDIQSYLHTHASELPNNYRRTST